jgi:hypothetical protein
VRLGHVAAIIFSGSIWFVIGFFLLSKGLNFVTAAAHFGELGLTSPLMIRLSLLVGGAQSAALLLIAAGLMIGFFKGRYVLAKSVRKGVQRIIALSEPIALHRVYNMRYYVLILIMVGLGMSMKWFAFPPDVRGMIDIAIGSALMNGALIYFRMAAEVRKEKQAK